MACERVDHTVQCVEVQRFLGEATGLKNARAPRSLQIRQKLLRQRSLAHTRCATHDQRTRLPASAALERRFQLQALELSAYERPAALDVGHARSFSTQH
jgi:hypothetical protein